jgi:tRNA modification GTPase
LVGALSLQTPVREVFHFAFGRAFAWVKRMSSPTDTIAALATPVGTSAIAVLRVSGPEVQTLVQEIFQEVPPARFARHADYRDTRGQLVDDVLFTYFSGPKSFTGEDSLEISCHGNPFVAQKILEDLLARGCQPAEPGEFSKRAFLNGRMDLSQAEAIMDLIQARSERALMAANQQLRGGLGRKMEGLITLLIKVLAEIEAYIDFPEEDLPVEDRNSILKQLDQLLAETGQLLATSHYGELLRDGIKTVIVGEPNAGKSSLLNRLVGRDRALVSAEPGTTRDYLEERVIMGPHGLRLIDTAGLNPLASSLEKLGIEKALEQADSADLFLWVIDASRPIPALLPALSRRMTPENTVVVFNKADLTSENAHRDHPRFRAVTVSALRGSGVGDLEREVIGLAEFFQVQVGSELIAINARHAQALEDAKYGLESARRKVLLDDPNELAASDLRGSLEAFGRISGRIDNEKILDRLFASFCIGK